MSDGSVVESFSASTTSTTVSESTPAGVVSTTTTTTADSNNPEPVTTTTSNAAPLFAFPAFSSSSALTGDAAAASFSSSSSLEPSASASSSSTEPAEVAPEEESTAQYTPVVKLAEVAVTTGEEDDETVYTQRAALYRFDSASSEWKERGKGDCKLLRNKGSGRVRLLMRQEKTLKLCANHLVLPGIDLKLNAGSDRSWTWRCQDFAGDEPENQTFAIRFKDSESHTTAPTASRTADAAQPLLILRSMLSLRCCAAANGFKAKWDEAKQSNAALMGEKKE